MPKFEMGDMPKAEESDEMDLEGLDYEAAEEEMEESPLEEVKSKVAEMEMEDLKELEAFVASELAKKEEGLDEEVEEAEDEAMAEEETEESEMGGLGAMFS